MLADLLRRRVRSSPRLARFFMNLWPPLLGSGIRVADVSSDYRHVRVELPLRFYNANAVGTQFGGSIYAMTDPFYMLMYIRALGPEYVVWDKAARVEFLKPGRRRLVAEFHLSDEDTEETRRRTADGSKHVFDKEVLVHDDEGVLVARVTKTLYVRKKERPVVPAPETA
jgi:acyl-coenzyme A thioesterase PaaI-like protein